MPAALSAERGEEMKCFTWTPHDLQGSSAATTTLKQRPTQVPPYGGNPCQKITTAPITGPQTRAGGPDPNPLPNYTVGGWSFSNAVLMHTLDKTGWTWTSDPVAALGDYDQNRVIGMMGSVDNVYGNPGLSYVYEHRGTPCPNEPNWKSKAIAPRARIYSNSVLLPDGTILVVGGQSCFEDGGNCANNCYWTMADNFDPQGPCNPGIWNAWAAPSIWTPRGYHSCAILVPDGSVLLMGGQLDDNPSPPSSEDTADVFKPPYLFKTGSRPVLHYVPSTIRYGQTFCLSPLVETGRQIVRFCLIGPGSVTHHFDYGQRYIELMFHSGIPACFPTANTELLGPPSPAMAPEGYYMLFGVDSAGVPSIGKFVKVTF
jgi:hypothetical protein